MVSDSPKIQIKTTMKITFPPCYGIYTLVVGCCGVSSMVGSVLGNDAHMQGQEMMLTCCTVLMQIIILFRQYLFLREDYYKKMITYFRNAFVLILIIVYSFGCFYLCGLLRCELVFWLDVESY